MHTNEFGVKPRELLPCLQGADHREREERPESRESIVRAKRGCTDIGGSRNLAKLLNECRHKLRARYRGENDLGHDHSLLAGAVFPRRVNQRARCIGN